MELHYNDLIQIQNQLTHGSGMLLEDEFYNCFKKTGLKISANDQNALKSYFQLKQNKTNQTVNMQKTFDFYGLTERLISLQNILVGYYSV